MKLGTKRALAGLLLMTMFFCWTISRRGVAPSSIADTARPLFGISYGETLSFMSDGKLAEALNDAVKVGVGWIRADLSWADVQPESPDLFIWDKFDRIVDQAHQRGLQVLPILNYTPVWARLAGCSTDHCAPADPSQFATFAGAAVQRYSRTGLRTWEIWNEPNSSAFWQPSADPVSYVRLLQASSATIRKADPGAFVLLGGLTNRETTGGDVSIADFLLRPKESPLLYVDALAVHPYTFPYPASRLGPWSSPWQPAGSGLPYLRDILAKAGSPGMPIWITEYGAPTGGPGNAWDGSTNVLSSALDHVTEEQQAAIASDAVATAASQPIIGALFWYAYQDFSYPLDTTESYYGIKRSDGSEKPSFGALTEAIKRLAR
jgi:hypothetical protein